MPDLTPVDSSMISAVGYDQELLELTVLFNSGQTYVYQEVPPEIYAGLMAASSKGQYMRAHILDIFPYRRQRRGRR